MSTIYDNSFSFINIYQYNDIINLYSNKITTQNVKDEIEGNNIVIPISNEVLNSSTKYVFFEFFPKKDIKK